MGLMHELALAKMETLLNQALARDLGWTDAAKPLHDQRILFILETLDYCVLAQISGTWVRLSWECADTPAHLTIKASPKACMQALKDKTLPRSIQISGDAFLAQHLQQAMFGLNIDWEGLLSDHVGDLPAKTLHRGLKKISGFLSRMADDVMADTHDYLLDEAKLVITPAEQQGFIDEVTELQYACDRLEARVKILQAEGSR